MAPAPQDEQVPITQGGLRHKEENHSVEGTLLEYDCSPPGPRSSIY